MNNESLRQAISATRVVLPPLLPLETFGNSMIKYYIVTKPLYAELALPGSSDDVVVREGIVHAERPRVVTPYFMKRLEGFSDSAKEYFDEIIKRDGGHAPGIYYAYKNQLQATNIVNGEYGAVLHNVISQVQDSNEKRTTVITGYDEYWDASLLKFIYELTANSLGLNIMQLGQHGLLGVDPQGVPFDARSRIESMFNDLKFDKCDLNTLRDELERYNLFNEYQDRFFAVVKYGKRALSQDFRS